MFFLSDVYGPDILGLYARTRTFFEFNDMVKRLQQKKLDKNLGNAEKRAEKEKKKFQELVEREVKATMKRKAEGLPEPNEDTFKPKLKRKNAGKNLRDHTKLGQLST